MSKFLKVKMSNQSLLSYPFVRVLQKAIVTLPWITRLSHLSCYFCLFHLHPQCVFLHFHFHSSKHIYWSLWFFQFSLNLDDELIKHLGVHAPCQVVDDQPVLVSCLCQELIEISRLIIGRTKTKLLKLNKSSSNSRDKPCSNSVNWKHDEKFQKSQ